MTPEVANALRTRRSLHAQTHGRSPARRPYFARQVPPVAVEQFYMGELMRLVEQMRDEVHREIGHRLQGWAEEAAGARRDSPGDDVVTAFGLIQANLKRGVFRNSHVRHLVAPVVERTSQHQKAQISRQLRVAVGIEVPIFDKGLGEQIQAFTAENVGLISSIPDQALPQVQNAILRGLAKGSRYDEIAEVVAKRFEVTESRAALIARDQVLKFYANLNETRQTNLGITHFIWRTAKDERTCPECGPLDGKRFAWADAPEGGPGEIHPQCRCGADPDVAGLLESL